MWDFADGQNALRGIRLCGRLEIPVVDLGDLDPRGDERLAKGLPPRRGDELRRDERASNGEPGAKQLFNRSHALGDEERTLLAGFSASQVAGESEEFHAVVVSGLTGMGLASASLWNLTLEHQ